MKSDHDSPYFGPRSPTDNPRWQLDDVRFKRQLTKSLTLRDLKQHRALGIMQLMRKGNRLSVMPVSKDEWDYILTLAESDD